MEEIYFYYYFSSNCYVTCRFCCFKGCARGLGYIQTGSGAVFGCSGVDWKGVRQKNAWPAAEKLSLNFCACLNVPLKDVHQGSTVYINNWNWSEPDWTLTPFSIERNQLSFTELVGVVLSSLSSTFHSHSHIQTRKRVSLSGLACVFTWSCWGDGRGGGRGERMKRWGV